MAQIRNLRAEVSAAVLFAVLALCVASATSKAQTPPAELIEWSKNRKLRRADFKGASTPASPFNARSAIEIQASWVCDGDRLDSTIRAVFDPRQSTWPSALRSGFGAASDRQPAALSDSLLLEHEQTHFDIAELVARKIRANFAELTDVCTRRGGTVPLAAVLEDYHRQLEEEQARYDRQTAFGTDARAQSMWTAQISKSLRSPERPSRIRVD